MSSGNASKDPLETTVDQLAQALENNDFDAAESHTSDLIARLRTLDLPLVETELELALDGLQMLRNKRQFELVARLADCLLQSGHRATKVRRLYAQALIDQDLLEAGREQLLKLLENAAFPIEDPAEYRQVRGLLGRIDKQIYLDSGPATGARLRQALRRAIASYREIYDADSSQLWHGINASALLVLAGNHGIPIPGDNDPLATGKDLATEMLRRIGRLHRTGKASVWDYAIAAEASLALADYDLAWTWTGRFTADPNCDVFHLASAERQMRQVWGLSSDTEEGARLLQALRAATLSRDDGKVNLEPADLEPGPLDQKTGDELEKVFGSDRFATVSWWLKGLEASKAVARIGRLVDEGEGTGFLVRGSDLHAALGDEILLLTNAHVVSDDPQIDSLRSDEVVVTFASQDRGQREFRIVEQLWTSPPGHFDASLLRLDSAAEDVAPLRLARSLPQLQKDYRVYVIGHPGGRGLSFSIQDNKLLDHGPMTAADKELELDRVHYRTPTEGGSSGSPVFNRQWRLIGLHHKGSHNMPKLNRLQDQGPPETYQANEGISIQSIRTALARDLKLDRAQA